MTAAAAYDGLFDRAVRHRIDLERYGESELRLMLRFVRDVERDTLRRIEELEAIQAQTRAERLRQDALEEALRQLRLIYAETYARLRARFLDGADELAQFEAEFQTRSLRAALNDLGLLAAGEVTRAGGGLRVLSPTVAQLQAVVRSRPLFFGSTAKLLSEWLEDLETSHRERIEGAIRLGFVEGENTARLAARVREAATLNARGAEALVRTAVTQIAAEVAQETYQLGAEFVREVEWLSVLDSRTTPICQARDGQRYPLDAGPRPPAHVRCRSTVIPILDGFPAPRRLTYGRWLARQSANRQDDILGPARGRLFREGVGIEQFVTPQGRPLTLPQLRARLDAEIPI